MSNTYVNKHGRKPGRGLRPWLLIPKVMVVGICLGGWVACIAVGLLAYQQAKAAGEPVAQEFIDVLHVLVVYMTVPALLLAMLLGCLLFLDQPRIFWRLRWLQVKMVIIILGVPTAHIAMRLKFQDVRATVEQQSTDLTDLFQFNTGLILTLVGTLVIITLGRLKPNLGQNWAKAFAKTKKN